MDIITKTRNFYQDDIYIKNLLDRYLIEKNSYVDSRYSTRGVFYNKTHEIFSQKAQSLNDKQLAPINSKHVLLKPVADKLTTFLLNYELNMKKRGKKGRLKKENILGYKDPYLDYKNQMSEILNQYNNILYNLDVSDFKSYLIELNKLLLDDKEFYLYSKYIMLNSTTHRISGACIEIGKENHVLANRGKTDKYFSEWEYGSITECLKKQGFTVDVYNPFKFHFDFNTLQIGTNFFNPKTESIDTYYYPAFLFDLSMLYDVLINHFAVDFQQFVYNNSPEDYTPTIDFSSIYIDEIFKFYIKKRIPKQTSPANLKLIQKRFFTTMNNRDITQAILALEFDLYVKVNKI